VIVEPHEAVATIVGIITIIGALLAALGWWIGQKINDATYQIQPNTNGGKSLTDLHKKVDSVCLDVTMIKSAVIQLEDDIEQLEHDVEELK
jgi:outer membrane murein-binding lipoprotein Lpp